MPTEHDAIESDDAGAATTAPPTSSGSDPPRLPPRLPVWRLYALSLATFGLYLFIWVFRFCRTVPGLDTKVRAVSTAGGMLAPPVGWAVLRELEARARTVGGRDDGGWRGLPAALYVVLLLVCGFTPLRHLLLAPVLLLPVPFLFVQRSVNVAIDGQRERAPVWHWIAMPLGASLLIAAAWLELPGFIERVRAPQRPGAVVRADDGGFALRVPGAGWRRASPGTIGDPDSVLELQGPGSESWLVAYSTPLKETTLEDTVGWRRGAIFGDSTVREHAERRYFLEGSEFVPVSVAAYRVDYTLGMEGAFCVLTAATDDRVHEVIGYTSEPVPHLDALRSLVLSFDVEAGSSDDSGDAAGDAPGDDPGDDVSPGAGG